jgi:thiamine kinase-like enzyme
MEEARQAVVAVATFHAWGWNNPLLAGLEDAFPPLDSARALAINENFMNYTAKIWPNVRDLPIVPEEIREFGDRLPELLPFFVRELSQPRTLAHGELRADNFFLTPDGEMILVDFQSLAQQSGMIDLAYLISQSIDEDVRTGHDEELVRLYQQTLSGLGISGYSHEDAWRQYRLGVAYMLHIPILAFIQAEHSDERGRALMVEMLARASDTIQATGALALIPTPGA